MSQLTPVLIAVLAFLPLTASAQVREANSMLRGQIQSLSGAGFSGMTEIHIPPAPTTNVALISVQADETNVALAALVGAAKIPRTFDGETARALGIDFNGENFPTIGIDRQRQLGGIYFFSVITTNGNTRIFMAVLDSIKQERPTYLVSTDGTLEAAALTRKVNGKFQAENIPLPEAQEGYRKLLEFWVRYYRENLKN